MKRSILPFFVIICLLCGISSVAQTVKQKVAIYVTGDVESGYKKVIGSKLVTGITRSDNYVAVERTADFLSELTREQDYQMSGAVSDNQIARIGQQFGVRYVLVAEISEIFESIFISARMIDVQTAQILKSAETDRIIKGIEDLTQCAENIVSKITLQSTFSENDVKMLTCSTFDDLLNCETMIPQGYHVATIEEIDEVIKIYDIMNQTLLFPIYTDIKSYNNHKRNTMPIKKYDRRTGKLQDSYGFFAYQGYTDYYISFTFVMNKNERKTKDLSYRSVSDSYLEVLREIEKIEECRCEVSGILHGTPKPIITPGYIYLIRNK